MEREEAPPAPPAGLITAKDAAEILGLGPDRVRDLARSGELPAVRIGTALRFVEEEVHAYAAERIRRGGRYPWRDGTLGLEAAAAALGISRWTLAKLADDGEISSVQRHGYRRFLASDLETFVEANRVRP